jgi:hypothetical protein
LTARRRFCTNKAALSAIPRNPTNPMNGDMANDADHETCARQFDVAGGMVELVVGDRFGECRITFVEAAFDVLENSLFLFR